MELYILRHGDAGPAQATADADNARALTAEGEQDIRRLAEFLKRRGSEAPTALVTSPLPRAHRTADIMREIFATSSQRSVHHSLARQDLHGILIEIVAAYPEHRTIMVVGHEPLLSLLGSVILTGTERPILELTKGGLLHISLYQVDALRPRGFLKMMIAPKDLG